MDKEFIVFEGIYDPRNRSWGWRTVGTFDSRREAGRFAETYPTARIVRAYTVHEHGTAGLPPEVTR